MTAPGPEPAGLSGVLETCLYHDPGQGEAVERFYAEVLGLPLVSRWPGGMAFRAGKGVVLLFDRDELARRDGPIAAHGTTGPGHACLLADGEDDYERWKSRLAGAGVAITHEHEWGAQRRSIYFGDPAANLLEIADGDLWPTAP
jgi:catechol 2,3-dioxygenase-like lactoylglutathione lyase family enzyme